MFKTMFANAMNVNKTNRLNTPLICSDPFKSPMGDSQISPWITSWAFPESDRDMTPISSSSIERQNWPISYRHSYRHLPPPCCTDSTIISHGVCAATWYTVTSNDGWKNFMSQLGIQHLMSTAYQPQTDGQTEHTNRTTETMLFIYASDTNWDDALLLSTTTLQRLPKSLHSNSLLGSIHSYYTMSFPRRQSPLNYCTHRNHSSSNVARQP